MPRMTDELKAYQDARAEVDAAQAKLNTATIALAARVAQEGGPITKRARMVHEPKDGRRINGYQPKEEGKGRKVKRPPRKP